MMSKWADAIPQAARIRRQGSFDPDEKVGVLVRFVKENHSDSYPFDGNGGSIGHAVHPDSITGTSQVASLKSEFQGNSLILDQTIGLASTNNQIQCNLAKVFRTKGSSYLCNV